MSARDHSKMTAEPCPRASVCKCSPGEGAVDARPNYFFSLLQANLMQGVNSLNETLFVT